MTTECSHKNITWHLNQIEALATEALTHIAPADTYNHLNNIEKKVVDFLFSLNSKNINTALNACLPCNKLNLSVRSMNCLSAESPCDYVGDLIRKSESDMSRIPKFGRRSLNETKEVLSMMGLGFGMCFNFVWDKDIAEYIQKTTYGKINLWVNRTEERDIINLFGLAYLCSGLFDDRSFFKLLKKWKQL